jgi:hypothetical protein
VAVIVQNAATRAYVGSSQDISSVGAVSSQIFYDYNTVYGGDTQHTAMFGSYTGLFPLDANFVLPPVTSLTASQVVPNAFNVTWADVGPVGNGTGDNNDSLDRYTVERQVNGGGYSELTGSPVATRYFVDDTGGLSNSDAVDYRVTHFLDRTSHAAAPVVYSTTVNNSSVLPVTANLVAHYLGDGQLGYANDQLVPTFIDYSGNGFNAAQAGTGQQPLYKSSVSALNNKPALLFPGVDEYMTATLTGLGATREIYAVFYKASAATSSSKGVLGFGNTANAYIAYANTGDGAGYNYYATQGGGVQNLGGTVTSPVVGSWTYTDASTLDFRFNNGTAVNFNPSDGYNSTLLTIGAGPGPDAYGDYYVAEIVIYSAVNSSGDRAAIVSYLRTKYNF